VAAAAVRDLVPGALTIDTFEGQAFVGLVPFTVTGARPMLMPPLPWVSAFHEVNVRTYVHRDGAEPGVWFFSLDAANPVVVAAARALFRLPYHHARMRMVADVGGIDFSSDRVSDPGAGCALRYEPLGTPAPAAVGTLEHFLAERYLLYTESGGRLFRAQVHHGPYPLQRARTELRHETLAAADVARPDTPPPLVHFAREVDVEIFGLDEIGDVG
jgi:uncharacterized protein YqjF (DUF2071 family)